MMSFNFQNGFSIVYAGPDQAPPSEAPGGLHPGGEPPARFGVDTGHHSQHWQNEAERKEESQAGKSIQKGGG